METDTEYFSVDSSQACDISETTEDPIQSEDPTEIKICLLGDVCVGKTSLVKKFVSGTFSKNSESTVRISFQTKKLLLDGKNVKVNIWDTAGQEKYRSLAPIYYRGADAAIIVYDITDESSFGVLRYWVKQLQTWIVKQQSNIVIAIAANKVDLEKNHRAISFERGQEFAEEIEALFEETSAKEGTNVNKLFIKTATLAVKSREKEAEIERGLNVYKEYHQGDTIEPGCPC